MNIILYGDLSRAKRIFDPTETVVEMNGGANEIYPRRLHREARG
jgi:hypothetical protein